MRAVTRRLALLSAACLLVAGCAQGGAGGSDDSRGDPVAGSEPATLATEPSGPAGTAPTPTTGATESRDEGALAFTAPLVAGGTFEGGDYDGRDVALWFWAPW